MGSAPSEAIESLRRHIETSPDIAAADAERLLAFSDVLAETTKDRRHERLLEHGIVLAEGLDDGLLAAALEDREAAEKIVEWIVRTFDDDETNRDFRVVLRVFGKKLAGEGDELPDSIGWIPTHVSAEFDTSPGHHI